MNLARIAGSRSVDILALALLQRMPPGLKEMAGAALIRAVDSGTQNWRLQQLAPAAGIPAAAQLVAVVIRSPETQQLRTAVEHLLVRGGHHSASYADNAELLVLAALRPGNPREDRNGIIAGLRSLAAPEGTVSAVGPIASGIASAHWSLAEARLTLELGRRRGGIQAGRGGTAARCWTPRNSLWSGWQCSPWTRPSGRNSSPSSWARILDHDAQRRSLLVETLRVWLDTGCNTAQAARELHVERQSMHQRLQRIFSLCGGDPRGTGSLAALHLATRLARLPRVNSRGRN